MQRQCDCTINYQLQQTGTRLQRQQDPNGTDPPTPDWTMHPKSAWAMFVPPPLCISYTKVPNQYGPYAYCRLDKDGGAQVEKEKMAW